MIQLLMKCNFAQANRLLSKIPTNDPTKAPNCRNKPMDEFKAYVFSGKF